MTKNDIIAEYVKKRCPEILETTDFKFFNLGMTSKNLTESFDKAIKENGRKFQKAVNDFNRKWKNE